METSPSIVELADQVSELAKQLYGYLREDLDRRMGAALGRSLGQDSFPLSQPRQSTNRAADAGNLPALARPQELSEEPDLSHGRP